MSFLVQKKAVLALNDAILPGATKNAVKTSWLQDSWLSRLHSSFSFSLFVIYSHSHSLVHPSWPPSILKMEPVTEKETGSVIREDQWSFWSLIPLIFFNKGIWLVAAGANNTKASGTFPSIPKPPSPHLNPHINLQSVNWSSAKSQELVMFTHVTH